MNKNIIILGPPDSGKGTQAKRLALKLNLTYFGAGDLIRDEIAKGTQLGKKIKAIVEEGELIDDASIGQIVRDNIAAYKDGGIIFDGFPRSLEQAHILEDTLPDEEFLVVNINVGAENLVKRMEKRWICDKCDKIFIVDGLVDNKKCDACGGKLIKRADDNREALGNRIDVYESQTKPLLDYYDQEKILINIDGEPSIEEVENTIWERVQKEINE